MQQAGRARVHPPRDRDTREIEDEETPKRRPRRTSKGDRRAVSLGDEKGAERRDRGGETDDRRAFFVADLQSCCDPLMLAA